MLLPFLMNLGMFTSVAPAARVAGGISRVGQPAKFAASTARLGWDFISKLRQGEWLESVTLAISIYKGAETVPTLVAIGSPTILGSQASQLLSGGDPGTVYFIEAVGTTNLGTKPYLTSYLTVR